MTRYTPQELGDDWEFKIVRAGTPVFRNREKLAQLVEEESRAGWVLLEKLDDQRVRFKRPRSARDQDAWQPQDVDPYRTSYGTFAQSRMMVVSLTLVGVLMLGVFAFLGVLLAGSGGPPIIMLLLAGLVFVLLLVGLAVVVIRR